MRRVLGPLLVRSSAHPLVHSLIHLHHSLICLPSTTRAAEFICSSASSLTSFRAHGKRFVLEINAMIAYSFKTLCACLSICPFLRPSILPCVGRSVPTSSHWQEINSNRQQCSLRERKEGRERKGERERKREREREREKEGGASIEIYKGVIKKV